MEKTSISKQIELVQNAYAKAGDALKLYNDYVSLSKHDCGGVRTSLLDAMARLTDLCSALSDERETARRRFRDVALLKATLVCNGRTVRVAVAKPSDRCDDPSLSESAYNAIRRRLGVQPGDRSPLRTTEAFDVAVLSRSGSVVETIARVLV